MKLETGLSDTIRISHEEQERRRQEERRPSWKLENAKVATVPTHMVNMKILNPNTGVEGYCDVIIPSVDVYYASKVPDEDYLLSTFLYYRLTLNGQAFPIAHIFSGSGGLCLGTIFVPPKIPNFDVLAPLNAILHHNDRVTNHGGATIVPDRDRMVAIIQYVNRELPQLDTNYLAAHRDWAKTDALWFLSSQVVAATSDLTLAIQRMEHIFSLLWATKE